MIDGANIHRLRIVLGLSMRQLADLLGVDQKTVYRWESGSRVRLRGVQRWAVETLSQVGSGDNAQAFGIEIGVILATKGPSAALQRMVQMSMDEFRKSG